MRRGPVLLALLLAALVTAMPARAQPAAAESEPVPAEQPGNVPAFADPCGAIEAAAVTHGLPLDFFTRLLWQESRFRPDAVSPKGAQGIAQFMPGTAAERGLVDPFDPEKAIWAAADLLADHRRMFGNLGLAAAAYNGGPTRVANWLAGSGSLPLETQNYVYIITGHPAESWSAVENRDGLDVALLGEPKKTTCPEIKLALARRAMPERAEGAASTRSPWGVQLTGSFSQVAALRMYANLKLRYGRILAAYEPEIISRRSKARGRRAFHRVRIGAQTRADAGSLCQRLRAAGAVCMVMRN